jgi:nitrite reductase [NAD(P)H], small subunit
MSAPAGRGAATEAAEAEWQRVCALDDLLEDGGVCARVGSRQVALFRFAGESRVYALDNHDPASGVNVLSRGLLGDLQGEPVVASPIYKQHYRLRDGVCVEDESLTVDHFPVELRDGQIWVCPQPRHVPVVAPQQTPRPPLRLVVVGNGMAAMRVVEEVLLRAPERYEVTVFGDEAMGNYNRILLSPVLAGEKKVEDIMLHPPEWYVEHGVQLHAGERVVEIDRIHRRVRGAAGTEVSYDRLLLATGSQPVRLPLPGIDLPGVTTFRDLRDVDRMLEAVRRHRHAVVIGGGLLGLEAAAGLARRGMQVTVVHLMPRLMERQLDDASAELLRATLEARGIRVRLAAKTTAILGEASVTGVRLENGEEIAADLVVMAVGIRPNIELAKSAGLHCERGVVVNDTMQTFDPRVYAVGECVQHRGSLFGLVAPIWEQARVAATQLAEQGYGRYVSAPISTQLKVAGIELYSAGEFDGGEGTETLVLRDPGRGIYKRVVLRGDRVVGAVLYGDARDGGWYYELMSERRDIAPLREHLLFGPQPDAEGESESESEAADGR